MCNYLSFGRNTFNNQCPTDGPSPVAKTGQTACYDETGTVIDDCNGTGQDGAYQQGVGLSGPRFTDNGDGTYSINMPKIADAFFVPSTFTATLTIEKQYFSTSTTSITIVVNMHETFGFPTFYLLMIVGAIVAVTASLGIYRTVQQARIPTFVKKARKVKKAIKSKKSISNSLLYPSKEEYLAKKLGDKWDMLGLSMQDILGIESKKKKLSESSENFKESKGGKE